MIQQLGLRQPENGTARSIEEARKIVERIGYPVVIRPSYVLGGRAMEIVRDPGSLERYMTNAVVVSGTSPVLIDSYLSDAIEVDVDALSDGKDVFVCGVMEHIEEAGIHSGDSACSLPPHSLPRTIVAEIERQTVALAKALQVGGLMNVQYAVKDGDIYILEVNPRASRTVPFVAKSIGIPIAKIAAKIMAGARLADFKLTQPKLKHISVKEAVFPFARFPNVDTLLGPEMKSTGEVMGIDASFPIAFAKSQIGAGTILPSGGTAFVSVKDGDKPRVVEAVKRLSGLGFRIIATAGTQRFLAGKNIPCEKVNKVLEGRPHIVDAIKNGEVQLVINTTEGAQALADSRSLRREALLHKVPYFTTLAGASAAALGIEALMGGQLEVRPLAILLHDRLTEAFVRGVPGNRRALILYCPGRSTGALEVDMEKVPMTAVGYANLEVELKRLMSEERPRIIQAISDARTHGDLSENAEYHAAKEAQSLNEGRIAELEDKISRAEVIDVTKLSGDTVKFGAQVKLVDEDTEEKKTYRIVGDAEADVKEGRISISSPIARALIGKSVGDTVEVTAPGGARSYEILKIMWGN